MKNFRLSPLGIWEGARCLETRKGEEDLCLPRYLYLRVGKVSLMLGDASCTGHYDSFLGVSFEVG